MDARCERCGKALPVQHVGSPLCSPCRSEVGVRESRLHVPQALRSGTSAAAAPRPTAAGAR